MLYQALTTIPCLISDFLEAGHKRGMETNVEFLKTLQLFMFLGKCQ